MSRSARSGRRNPKTIALALITAGVTAFGLTGSGGAMAEPPPGEVSAHGDQAKGLYIVQVAGAPAAVHDGDDRQRRTTLAERHDDVLRAVPGAEKVYDYGTVFNGFAARMTGAQAAELARADGVLHVWKDEIRQPDTVSTPDFLGLTGRHGVWREQFHGHRRAGEGVIVGVVDSGVWPENPAFAALPTPRPDADVISRKWKGTCDEGADTEENNVSCNNKLIGARYYHASVDPIEAEFESPRDHGGHGTHTASTAVGNHGVEVVVNGASQGTMSGMAPAARLAVYKVCWTDAGCGTADSVAAIDQAVADGVDVINYSISGSMTYVVDPVEIAFYNAARSGVFVAASAGNDGPGASTVAHNSPWITTVAAGTHDRAFSATATLGDGTEIVGAGLGEAVPETDLVLSADAGVPDATAEEARLCYPGALDESVVAGKVVACARGIIARVDKSLAVQQAGGAGMILYNTSPDADDIAADFHYVPTVHVRLADAEKVEAYAAQEGATVSFSAGEQYEARAPEMAAFSSAGPALAGHGDLLKPDVTAPGVDVLAAVAPPGNAGEDFASYQGTSMSSPHIAGLAALLVSRHPGWNPMWIKSALMTTARQTDNRGKPIQRAGKDATPLDFGAGHVNPEAAFDPGLVYDSDAAAWVAYMCAIGQGRLVEAPCGDVAEIDPSDLNTPSIAVGDLAGVQTVTRTVTNPGKRAGVYRAKVVAPPGTKVTVTPSRLVVPPRSSKTFKVRIERTDAPFDDYTFGSLTWKSLSHSGADVRSPIVIRPVAVAAPPTVAGSGASGSTEIELKAGYSGTLNAEVDGLVAAEETTLELSDPTRESFDIENPTTGPHTGKVTVTVPEGAALARFATFAADYADLGPGTDLDLFVYRKGANGLELVDLSASGGSDEAVTLGEPGEYEIYVDLWSSPDGVTSLTARHYHWVVAGEEGNVTVEPTTQEVAIGEPASVTATWEGLTEGVRYLGVVRYGDAQSTRTQTVLEITG